MVYLYARACNIQNKDKQTLKENHKNKIILDIIDFKVLIMRGEQA